MLGIDYAWRHPRPEAIAAAGFGFVLRYLSPDASKNLTASEAKGLLAAGLDIGVVWEATANRALGGAVAGAADGARAKQQADGAGATAASAIYFAVDFDAQPSQMATIGAYSRAFAAAIAPHPVGVYGSGFVCNQLAATVAYRWQSMSTGFLQSRTAQPGICLWQRRYVTVDGVQCDANDQLGPFGGWRASTGTPQPPVVAPLPPPIHFGDAMTRNDFQIPVGADGTGWAQSDFDYLRIHSFIVQGPFQNEGHPIPKIGCQNRDGKAHISLQEAPPAAGDPYLFPIVVWTVDA